MQTFSFRCWEQQSNGFIPSLIGFCTRTGRMGYFEAGDDLTRDITSMATTSYTVEGEDDPLIAIKLQSARNGQTLYAPLKELAGEIASMNNDSLWRMLQQITLRLAPQHRLA